ncbi:MAG: TSUP family transporter [Rhizobiales bacterium]|nr:TSUP family transporter [Hyphomicrobiales bacterium]
MTMGVGALSGTLMAATSLGNPPVMVYLLSSRDRAEVNRANFTGYFAITLAALLILMAIQGLLTWRPVQLAALMLVPFMAGAWIGSRLFRKSSEGLYRRVALGLLLLAGLYGLLRP